VWRGLPSGGAGNSLATSDKYALLALLFIRVIAPLAANRPVIGRHFLSIFFSLFKKGFDSVIFYKQKIYINQLTQSKILT
jgi:hypothetical protein